MSSLISTAANSTFTEFDTRVPGLTQAADIIEAFKLYHYGKDDFGSGDTPSSNSIYGHLKDLKDEIDQIVSPDTRVNSFFLIGA